MTRIKSRGRWNGIASSISAKRKYRDRLNSLAEMQGSDNSPLLGLCSLGVRAGFSDEQVISDIRHANGKPPSWSDSATKRALKTARAGGRQPSVKSDRTRTRRMALRPSQKQETPPLGRGAETFVRRRVTEGQDATFESLIESSPIPIPSDTREQARIFLQTLYNPQEWVFIGNTTDAGTGLTIKTVNGWLQPTDSARLRTLPFLMANPLTGGLGKKKDGQPSCRCGECVAAFRFALVEFDGMPLSEQCAFWTGVIKSPNMFPLCTLVYSGGKSIHGLIEIDAKDRKDWDAQIQLLQSAVCNLNAPKAFQADRVCKNVDRLTRLAGAYRSDKGNTIQRLLWLSKPISVSSPVTTIPIPPIPTRRSISRDRVDVLPPAETARCRDCWNWIPNGIQHGCSAGIASRLSPDWRGACPYFERVN